MKNQKPLSQTGRSGPISPNISDVEAWWLKSKERISQAMEAYRRSVQEEQEMLSRREPIFIIPEPTQWELARRQRHEARQKWLQEQPDFYIPSTEQLAAEKARHQQPRERPASKPKRKAFLPSRIPGDQLALYGYQLILPTTAKHKRFRSYRHYCWLCQLWTKRGSAGLCDRHSFC